MTHQQQLDTLLCEISEDAAFLSTEGQPFISLPIGSNCYQTMPFYEPVVRDWFINRFFRRQCEPPNQGALRRFFEIIRARATCMPTRTPVANRIGRHPDGSIQIDLANSETETVEITSNGWQISRPSANLIFRSTHGQLPLPHPQQPATTNSLPTEQRTTTNAFLTNPAIRDWLLAALHPTGPYPILILHGPPNSGKSTLAKMLRSLLDPVTTPLVPLPSRERAISNLAIRHRVLAFDHVTRMSPTATDALCRISTGAGIEVREPGPLRSSIQLQIARPIIITTPRNGIGDWIPRDDLASRAIAVHMPALDNPRPAEDLDTEFEAARPGILATLYTVLSSNLGTTRATSYEPRTTTSALYESSSHADPLFAPLLALPQTTEWTGTATDLLNEICVTPLLTCSTPRALSQRLNLLTPALMTSGVEITHHRKHLGDRLITLRLPRRTGLQTCSRPTEQDPPTNPDSARPECLPRYHVKMLNRSMLLACLCLGLLHSQTVPTPESVLGHKPGDDFYLANYDESRDYFHKLAASSNRVKLITVGKTTRGLDWEIAIISSPENLAKLDHYKDISRRLAYGRGLTDDAAKALAHEGKAIVHIDGGLHSTEVAGAQQSIALAYKLISSQGDPEVDAILDNVILMLWPTLNPDGQNEVVAWYRKNVGTSFEVSPLPDLYQEYVGHDNNRDGYMNNMIESQDVTRTELEWDPVIFYCHHQTAPFPTRIFIPPFTEPISSNINPLMARWLNVLGINMAAYLDEHQMPGAVHRVGFDNWYPGFLDFTHIFRHSISFFTETALYRYATPHFYTVDEFPKERQALNSEALYSSPWKGGWWRLSDAVRYMLGGSMSVLDTAAKYREVLLYNRYQAARDTIDRFRKEPPFAYVIPQEQRDLPTAATLVEKLLLDGIEVHQATKPFEANGRQYRNAWIILMDQPFGSLVKELFEPQVYPDLRTTPNGPPIRPYDVAGWTLPMQMGVEVDGVLKPLSDAQRGGLQRIEQSGLRSGTVEGTGTAFVIGRQTNASYQALNDALAKGGKAGFTSDGKSIVVSGIDREPLTAIAHTRSIAVQAVAKSPDNVVATKKPRVGLYRSWMGNIDEGWTRWILENYGFAPVTLRNGDIQAGHLLERLDTIILPDSSARAIADGFAKGSIAGEYAGGLGEPGAEALRAFVRGGGTLIAFNNASQYAIEALSLPVSNVLTGLNNDQFYCSGSLLRVQLGNMNHPALAGMPSEPVVMFERGPAFEAKAAFRGNILATYSRERNPLASGYLLHPEVIQGKAAELEVFLGSGRVYLFGFRPQWRGQSHGTYKLVFDAIYDSPSSSKPTTVGEYSEIDIKVLRPADAANAQLDDWRRATTKIHTDLTAVLKQNQAFAAAKGAKAVEERGKLTAAIDQFEKDDIRQAEDAVLGLPEAARRRGSEYVRQLRAAAESLKSREFEPNAGIDSLLERFRLTEIEQEIAGGRPR